MQFELTTRIEWLRKKTGVTIRFSDIENAVLLIGVHERRGEKDLAISITKPSTSFRKNDAKFYFSLRDGITIHTDRLGKGEISVYIEGSAVLLVMKSRDNDKIQNCLDELHKITTPSVATRGVDDVSSSPTAAKVEVTSDYHRVKPGVSHTPTGTGNGAGATATDSYLYSPVPADRTKAGSRTPLAELTGRNGSSGQASLRGDIFGSGRKKLFPHSVAPRGMSSPKLAAPHNRRSSPIQYVIGKESPSIKTKFLTNFSSAGVRKRLKDKNTPVKAFKRVRPSGTTPLKLQPNISSFLIRADAPATSELPLSKEQQAVLSLVLEGQSIFFTGAAGTGKSHLLQEIVSKLPKKGTVATAPTGIAACNINGCTIHQWAGIGISMEPAAVLAATISRSFEQKARWLQTMVLIIDEISMLDGDLFDLLEEIARIVRGSDEPFGGIQLVLCGDFLQLPPVATNSVAKKFCFEAKCWSDVIGRSVELKEIFRQRDSAFIALLNEIRRGECSPNSVRILNKAINKEFDVTDGITPTELHTHKRDVEVINSKQLKELEGESHVFKSRDVSSAPRYIQQMNSMFPAVDVLNLKVGAQVILTKTIRSSGKDSLVNGLRGIVTKICGKNKFPYVLFANGVETLITYEMWQLRVGGKEVASRQQLPLNLGWALSIHKSQGMTLDKAVISFGNAFEFGQAYVALSRVKSLDGLSIRGVINYKSIKAAPSVIKFYDSFASTL